MRLIRFVAESGHRHGCTVGICGELGAETGLTEEFLKMGIRNELFGVPVLSFEGEKEDPGDGSYKVKKQRILRLEESYMQTEKNMAGSYEIIVLDLDGTLTNRDKVITPRTKTALMKRRSGEKRWSSHPAADSGRDAVGKGAVSGRVQRLYPFLQRR